MSDQRKKAIEAAARAIHNELFTTSNWGFWDEKATTDSAKNTARKAAHQAIDAYDQALAEQAQTTTICECDSDETYMSRTGHECCALCDKSVVSRESENTDRGDTERPDEREYRYECAHGHSWITAPTGRMKCCVCGTITLERLKPIDHYAELARQLWLWNGEHGGTSYPYDRLIELTKDDLRSLARRLAPFVVVRDTDQEPER